MAELVYVLCMLTSGGCALLLLRSYRRAQTRLLLWSSLCFFGLALNNALLFIDLVIIGPSTDLSTARNVTALVALATLIYGLVMESD